MEKQNAIAWFAYGSQMLRLLSDVLTFSTFASFLWFDSKITECLLAIFWDGLTSLAWLNSWCVRKTTTTFWVAEKKRRTCLAKLFVDYFHSIIIHWSVMKKKHWRVSSFAIPTHTCAHKSFVIMRYYGLKKTYFSEIDSVKFVFDAWVYKLYKIGNYS